MNHLNTATQQNASASEELSATAEELSGQAAQLQEMMAFFRLSRGDRAAVPVARHSAAPRELPPSLLAKPLAARTTFTPKALDESQFARF